jgi:hypothetical protein
VDHVLEVGELEKEAVGHGAPMAAAGGAVNNEWRNVRMEADWDWAGHRGCG